MTIDINKHRTILFQIVKDVYSDPSLGTVLGFKGETAALMFYALDRFSVDLDFDLLDKSKEDLVFEKITSIAKKYGKIKESVKKRFNLFWQISYEDKAHTVKIEINSRLFGSKYKVKNYLGVSVLVMVDEDVFANKLMALCERLGKTSRDLYDIWFFLNKRFEINKKLVEERSGRKFESLIRVCIQKIEKLESNEILNGLGELLTQNQKDWAKEKLKNETISLLRLLI